MYDDEYGKFLPQIADEQDRVLFQEAVNCAKSNAFRAAYIMVWLSAAESLKRKFKILATQDTEAGQIQGQIDQKEKQQQAIDVFLLDKSKDYGFLSDSEHTRLRHIYELRCVFGHPYEEQPTFQALQSAMTMWWE